MSKFNKKSLKSNLKSKFPIKCSIKSNHLLNRSKYKRQENHSMKLSKTNLFCKYRAMLIQNCKLLSQKALEFSSNNIKKRVSKNQIRLIKQKQMRAKSLRKQKSRKKNRFLNKLTIHLHKLRLKSQKIKFSISNRRFNYFKIIQCSKIRFNISKKRFNSLNKRINIQNRRFNTFRSNPKICKFKNNKKLLIRNLKINFQRTILSNHSLRSNKINKRKQFNYKNKFFQKRSLRGTISVK